MFFAKLGKRSLEYIARYSHDQHISLDKAFRQILLLGLSQLEAQISVAARDERKKFIQEHWQLESDKELAIACNCSIDEIRDERSVLGLKRQLGRRTFSHRRDEVNEIIRVPQSLGITRPSVRNIANFYSGEPDHPTKRSIQALANAAEMNRRFLR